MPIITALGWGGGGKAKGWRAYSHSELCSETLSQKGKQHSAWLVGQFKDAIKDPNSTRFCSTKLAV